MQGWVDPESVIRVGLGGEYITRWLASLFCIATEVGVLSSKSRSGINNLCLLTYLIIRCRQWREASYTTPFGEVQRVYTVCNVDVPNTDNWLRPPYIASPAANRIYVRIRFSVRRCVNFPNPATLQQCKVICFIILLLPVLYRPSGWRNKDA